MSPWKANPAIVKINVNPAHTLRTIAALWIYMYTSSGYISSSAFKGSSIN
jgi:hypothetical protein